MLIHDTITICTGVRYKSIWEMDKMKLVFIFGSTAVGKMTVGQELAKQTELSLFHNHMMIEPVLDVFGDFRADIIKELRDVVFREFAASGKYGLIFTMPVAFDIKEDMEYVEHIKDIFRPYGTEFYYAELTAPQSVRILRNTTVNRLLHKPSKRNTIYSNNLLIQNDKRYRMESYNGEITFENYIKLDNTDITADCTAEIIKNHFEL